MRFKNISVYIVCLVAVYCLYLGITSDLDYYIHPRYELFTMSMSAVCVVLLLVTTIGRKFRMAPKQPHVHKEPVLIYLPILCLLLAALVLPARSLRSSTVSQRIIDGQSTTTSDETSLRTVLSGSSKGLGIADWAQLLATNTESHFYQNKPAKISGFIYDADLGANTVWVARFAVTCCAVDARPIGIPVHVDNWSDGYKVDDWVEVEGIFTSQQTNKNMQIVLMPEAIKHIQEPQNPYVN